MQPQIVQILEQKISETVRSVDERTAAEVRNLWGTVGPSPACPAVSDLMKQINRICHQGLVERGEKAREVTVDTLKGFQRLLDEKSADEVMNVLARHFRGDEYLALAKNTKGVYGRRQAQHHKFSERAYELEVAAISAGSANLSRRALASIRNAVKELILQNVAGTATKWEHAKTFILHQLALPVIRWIFGILALIVAAVVIYWLGISKG